LAAIPNHVQPSARGFVLERLLADGVVAIRRYGRDPTRERG
jgi:hypothetical protein